MRAYNPRVAGVNPADLVDDSVLKQLYDMRFIEKLFTSYGIESAGK